MNTLGESTMTTPVKPSTLLSRVTSTLGNIMLKNAGNRNDYWVSLLIRDEVLPTLELVKRRVVIMEGLQGISEVLEEPSTDDRLPIDEITQAVYERLTTHHMADLQRDIEMSYQIARKNKEEESK